MQKFAQNMVRIRKNQGISTQKLAELAVASRSMIYKIENEQTQPSLDMAMRIAAALGTTLTCMIDEEEATHGTVIPKAKQNEWRDPQTGLVRRSLLPVGSSHEWAAVTLPKGETAGTITLPSHKRGYLYILKGDATIEFKNQDDKLTLTTGDLFVIPAGITHFLTNTGKMTCEYFVLIEL